MHLLAIFFVILTFYGLLNLIYLPSASFIILKYKQIESYDYKVILDTLYLRMKGYIFAPIYGLVVEAFISESTNVVYKITKCRIPIRKQGFEVEFKTSTLET